MAYIKRSCYKCGNVGHFANVCPEAERLCYNCKQPGHYSADCTTPKVVEPKQCFNCGGVGHIQSQCTNPRSTAPVATKPSRALPQCFNCQQHGHLAKECTQPSQPREPRHNSLRKPRRQRNIICHKCGGINHFAKDCKASDILCYNCNKYGHIARECTSPGFKPKPKTCFVCQKPGHIARNCLVKRQRDDESEQGEEEEGETESEEEESYSEGEYESEESEESEEPIKEKLQKLIILFTILTFVKAQSDDPVEQLVDADLATNIDSSVILESSEEAIKIEKSFIISLLMIIVSEIGDKTFLIAAIMAMKHSRLVVFSAAFSSLAIMSILSAFLGHVVPNLIPKQYTDVCASVLFLCFGARMLYEAYHMEEGAENEEMAEVEEELKIVEDREQASKLEELEVGGLEAANHTPTSKKEHAKEGLMNLMQLVFSPVFVQTFVLTFLGEWGDRSQISTIALAAANNVYYVTAGVVIGHGLCTAGAVIGGRMLATKISVRTVTFAGAILFLLFGIFYGFNAYNL
ncbi:hypothetical protein G6F57_009590 [Rhizopus arrhizus]|nr:hypothetical protein G6F24_010692 [Rhizopus arrhizus]KAG0907268.1 hypothetical protein G6F33_010720 [Rhizopus arrhizus]KAG0931823.1 hypothetical protein G6F30_011014 [Rhizopus arrhizus]KAG0932904.1 hypothetical protein G6F32_011231 [Rhizopus arrhizus]KAG0977030.1 hypothetical protein G6F29_010375 [Rhizopus arrhizus]